MDSARRRGSAALLEPRTALDMGNSGHLDPAFDGAGPASHAITATFTGDASPVGAAR